MANETKFVFTASTTQAEAALGKLGNSIGGVSRKMFDLSGIVGTLGGALTITAFAGIIRQSIDAADELNNLSIKTGTSVEQLAGLKYAAEQSDTSLQAVANAAKKLSTNLAENPDLFNKFGIDAKDSTGALIQLADIFATMPDGVEKTALAVKLMGKTGEEMIPFLNQGGEAIRTLVEHGKEYNPVTAESARMAAEFNDNLDKLKASAGQAGMAMTNEMLPQLSEISNAMAIAAREGGLLKAAWVGLGGLGTALFTDDMLPRVQQINNELEKLRNWEASLEGDVMARLFHPNDLRDTRAQIILLEGELKDLQKAAAVPVNKPDGKPVAESKGNSLLKALGGGTSSPKTDPNASSVLSMQNDEFRKQMELLGVTSEQTKVYELAMKGATKAQIAQAQATADSIGAINTQIQAEKDLTNAAAEAQKIILDINPIAKASAEWDKLIALKEKGLLTDEQIGQAYAKIIGDMEEKTKKSTDGMSDTWKTFADNTQRTLGDVLFNGMNGQFNNIEDMFKQMLLRMAANAAAAKITEGLFGDAKGVGGLLSGLFNANGNAFTGSGVAAFANGGAFTNGVFNAPTAFKFAAGGGFNLGVMGEAGPEAVMPLSRGKDGKLGIRSQSGNSVQVTYAPTITIDSRTDQAQVRQLVDSSVRQGNAELVDTLQRRGVL